VQGRSPEQDPDAPPRQRRKTIGDQPLFDNVTTSKHTVNGGSHKQNTAETILKDLVETAETTAERNGYLTRLGEVKDSHDRERVIMEMWRKHNFTNITFGSIGCATRDLSLSLPPPQIHRGSCHCFSKYQKYRVRCGGDAVVMRWLCTGDMVVMQWWGCAATLRRQITRRRVPLERCGCRQDETADDSNVHPARGTQRNPTKFTQVLAGKQWRNGVMAQELVAGGRQLIQCVICPPYVKRDAHYAQTCMSELLYFAAAEGIEMPPNMHHLGDGGPNEWNQVMFATNCNLMLLGFFAHMDVARGPVGRNHSFLDKICQPVKAASRGGKGFDGKPANSASEVEANIRFALVKAFPNAKVRVVSIGYTHDYSAFLDGYAGWKGCADYRQLSLDRDANSGGVRAAVYETMADTRPVSCTTDAGDVVPSWLVYSGDARNPVLPMAKFSPKGLEQARTSKEVMIKVLKNPRRYGLKAPKSAIGRLDEYWADALTEAEGTYIPTSATEHPPGFVGRRGIPQDLKRQSGTAVQDTIVGVGALVPALVPPQAPHVGTGPRRKRRPYVNLTECPMTAAFQCEDTPGQYTVAIMMVTAVARDEADGARGGDDIYKGVWFADPTLKDNGTGSALRHSVQSSFVGAPRHRLLAADKAFNHGTNMTAGTWNKRNGKLAVTATGMRLHKTLLAEVGLRMEANPAATPPALLTATEARERDDVDDDCMDDQQRHPPNAPSTCAPPGAG